MALDSVWTVWCMCCGNALGWYTTEADALAHADGDADLIVVDLGGTKERDGF